MLFTSVQFGETELDLFCLGWVSFPLEGAKLTLPEISGFLSSYLSGSRVWQLISLQCAPWMLKSRVVQMVSGLIEQEHCRL